MNKIRRHTKRTAIAIAGGVVVLVGIVLIPYPGPGWLVVFAGLAILATEFAFAAHLLERGQRIYNQWLDWLKVQPRIIQLTVLALTGLVVMLTVWLLNGFGIINGFLQLGQDWVRSPFFR